MGKDKIFLELSEGVTFIEHLYGNAKKVFERVLISAGSSGHAKLLEELLPEAELVTDQFDSIGPMGGIVSVFIQTGIDRFAVIPADVPGAELRVPAFFYDRCGDGACLLKEREFPEPLIAAYGRKTLSRMKEMAESGSYRLRDALPGDYSVYTPEELKEAIPELKEVRFEEAFCNINTEQEYLKMIGSAGTKKGSGNV